MRISRRRKEKVDVNSVKHRIRDLFLPNNVTVVMIIFLSVS